jgi:signal transduction histidine kinase
MQQVRSEMPSFSEPKQAFDVVVMLNECASAAVRMAGDRAMAIRRQFPDFLHVYTEPNRLRSIVMNLLGNAVEYGKANGTIEISCALLSDQVVLSVSDDGPGIADDLLPHVFEPFVRGQTQQAMSKGDEMNLGLGLSLVKAHARALGGRCEVESSMGVGTTFRVVLPRSIVLPSEQKVA